MYFHLALSLSLSYSSSLRMLVYVCVCVYIFLLTYSFIRRVNCSYIPYICLNMLKCLHMVKSKRAHCSATNPMKNAASQRFSLSKDLFIYEGRKEGIDDSLAFLLVGVVVFFSLFIFLTEYVGVVVATFFFISWIKIEFSLRMPFITP